MSLSHTVSEIDASSVENHKFFPPRVFNAPAGGVSLGIWYRRRGQKKTGMTGLTDGRKNCKIALAIRRNTGVWRTSFRPSIHPAIFQLQGPRLRIQSINQSIGYY